MRKKEKIHTLSTSVLNANRQQLTNGIQTKYRRLKDAATITSFLERCQASGIEVRRAKLRDLRLKQPTRAFEVKLLKTLKQIGCKFKVGYTQPISFDKSVAPELYVYMAVEDEHQPLLEVMGVKSKLVSPMMVKILAAGAEGYRKAYNALREERLFPFGTMTSGLKAVAEVRELGYKVDWLEICFGRNEPALFLIADADEAKELREKHKLICSLDSKESKEAKVFANQKTIGTQVYVDGKPLGTLDHFFSRFGSPIYEGMTKVAKAIREGRTVQFKVLSVSGVPLFACNEALVEELRKVAPKFEGNDEVFAAYIRALADRKAFHAYTPSRAVLADCERVRERSVYYSRYDDNWFVPNKQKSFFDRSRKVFASLETPYSGSFDPALIANPPAQCVVSCKDVHFARILDKGLTEAFSGQREVRYTVSYLKKLA